MSDGKSSIVELAARIIAALAEIEQRLANLEETANPASIVDHAGNEARTMVDGGTTFHRYQLPRDGWWLIVIDDGGDLKFRVQHDSGRQIVLQVIGEAHL
jgi:hypothetical protein